MARDSSLLIGNNAGSHGTRILGGWSPLSCVFDVLEVQRGHLMPWIPVLMGMGIGLYFQAPSEPGAAVYGGVICALVLLALCMRRYGPRAVPVLMVFFVILTGFGLAGLRAHLVSAPVLGFRYYGPVEGRIVVIDRSSSDKVRLTLDRVVLDRMSPHRTPARVRVSLHGQQGFIAPEPGMTVMLTGHLSPPQGPVEPGGFDFRRMAWFSQVGAVGYTRSPVLGVAPARSTDAGMWIHRLRLRISGAVQNLLPGETGAFAAAIMTGDRSGMGQGALQDLRSSNLAHLLAISGLHMGLLTGFVFAAMRYALVAVPWIGLRLAVKKTAAMAALLAGGFYYLLSGGNVATERAFIMAAVMLVAVLFDRRAITLRAVAMAATIVLVLRPETLTQPGFQMSFAATTALVAVFGQMREIDLPRLPKPLLPVIALIVSSAVAGAATAPVAAAHFNRIADYGLLANLLSVPLMGAVVMPAAVLSACLWPLGGAWIGLAIMRPAIDWILGVSHFVSDLPGSVTPVVAPQPAVLPVFALGMLWVILWRARGRWIGVIPAILSFVLWSQADRPPLLVSATGGLIGLMTENGRSLSKPKGDGFSAQSWLENDGDLADQETASRRPGLSREPGQVVADIDGVRVIHLSGRGMLDRVAKACETADLVVLAREVPGPKPCLVMDAVNLRNTGALAVYQRAGKMHLVPTDVPDKARLWSGN